MKMKYTAVATIGEYTDKATGKKAKRTLPIGAVFESAGGRLVLKLDAVPVSADWSGWVALKPCNGQACSTTDTSEEFPDNEPEP